MNDAVSTSATQGLPQAPARSLEARVGAALPWLGVVLLWMLLFNYQGIFHDAMLYTFQALARLHPELYANDLFLRFGSQDQFTIFSPLYAAAIRFMGLEPAAATLTFCSQLMLFGAAYLLARTFLSARLAVVSIGLLMALPSFYAARQILQYLETFLTPRLPAEALAVAGLAAIIHGRTWLAAASLCAASLLHPVMAAPGVAAAVYLSLGNKRPRLFWTLCGGSLIALIAIGLLLPSGSTLRFDDAWLSVILDHADYIFVTRWDAIDFQRAAVPCATLAIGRMVLEPGIARRLCESGLFVALMGVVVSLIGADWLNIALIGQAQLYRWLWLAGFLSVLTLTATAQRLLSLERPGDTVLFLLAAMWISADEPHAPWIIALACVSAWAAMTGYAAPRHVRLAYLASAGLLCCTLLFALASGSLSIGAAFQDTAASNGLDRLRSTLRVTLWLHVGVFTAICWMAQRVRNRAALTAVALLMTGVIIWFTPVSITEWTQRRLSENLPRQFAGWREQIPVGEEVLWFDGPLYAWLLLERPNYISVLQTGTALFSRPAALEMQRREHEVLDFLYYARLARPKDGETIPNLTLQQLCAKVRANYVVSRADLHAKPLLSAPAGVSATFRGYRLYGCRSAER